MPKLGQAEDTRPHNKRCRKCKCLVKKLVSRFGYDGKPAAHSYRCENPYHNCGTAERDGCEPVRVYEPVAHAYWDGGGGHWEHPGPLEDCDNPECADRKDRHRAGLAPGGTWHPGTYGDCFLAECEPPFERSDVATSGDTSWQDHNRGPWGEWPPSDPGPWPGPLAGDEDV